VSEAHFGIAKLHMRKNELDEALPFVENTIKNSIALQSIHWQARRTKAEIHLKKKEYKKAEFELKLLAKRRFSESNPNYAWKRADIFNYGYTLFLLGEFESALEQFEHALKINTGKDSIPESEKFYYRGLAKQKSGKNGYISDLKTALKLGDKRAGKLLEELV
jgi:tetratricopeptide (TPR) repeat protein